MMKKQYGLFIALVAMVGSVQAVVLDLTTAGSSGTINGALFQQIPGATAGTGLINSFVRVQANGTEEGFNATVRPVMTNVGTDPNFTRDIRLSEVPIVAGRYEFLLDINQTLPGALLNLDALRIFTRGTAEGGALTAASQLTDLTNALNIHQRYSLDDLIGGVNNTVTLNYALNSGSGAGDLAVYVPVSAFAGSSPSDFVYLYSRFGEGGINPGNDGFEEWSVRVVQTAGVDDAGSSLVLLGLGLVAIGLTKRLDWFGGLQT
jgi:hypothetical protein